MSRVLKHSIFKGLIGALIGALLSPSSALADSSEVSNVSTDVQLEKEKKEKNYSINLSTSLLSDFLSRNHPDKEIISSNSVSVNYALKNNGPLISSSIRLEKELTNTREMTLKDSNIGIAQSLKDFNDWGNLTLKFSTFIPLSEYSRKVSKLNTGYRLSPILSIDLSKFGIKGTNVIISPGIVQNFHSLEVSKNGNSNSQFYIYQGMGISYLFFKNWTLGMNGELGKIITYQGTSKDQFLIEQFLAIQTTKNTSLILGHENGGNFLGPNGDTNIELFNKNGSRFYLVFNFTF